jgi:hypothetical protein
VKKLQTGKDLVCAGVISKSVEISGGAINKCIYELCVKWSINPVTNPKPRRESLIHMTI